MTTTELYAYFKTHQCVFTLGWQHPVGLGRVCPVHTHPHIEIVYHPTGTGVTLVKGEPLSFDAGEVVIYPPLAPHTQEMSEAGLDVCLQVSLPSPLPPPLRNTRCVPVPEDENVRHEILALTSTPPLSPIHQLAYNHRATAILIQLLLAAVGTLGTHESKADQYVRNAGEYMQAHYRTITRLREVADALSISEDYLRHIFRARHQQSLSSWLTQIRIARAKELLTCSTLPLKAIADLCGFDNERYLSYVFKTHERCTPGQYRFKYCATK